MTSGNKYDYGDYIYGRAALGLLEPWIVPEALGFLKAMFPPFEHAKNGIDIFEWGAGASTVWLGRNTSGNVYSVEQGTRWFKWAGERVTDNVQVSYVPGVLKGVKVPLAKHYRNYADAIFDILPEDHDVQFIFVDGERRVRNRCVANAVKVLQDRGGVIMVDNSNWPDMKKGVALLKDWHCLNFDAPKSTHLPEGWCTSFYIKPGSEDHD